MLVRSATPDDAEMIARVHVQAWGETYVGVLPESEIAKRDLAYRMNIWTRAIAQGTTRIAVAPGFGFAQMGRQRDATLLAKGYAEELFSFYVLRPAYGIGLAKALLRHALGAPHKPFLVFVLDDNPRACGFYEKVGMRHLETRDEMIDSFAFRERAYVCDTPDHIFAD